MTVADVVSRLQKYVASQDFLWGEVYSNLKLSWADFSCDEEKAQELW